MMYSVLGSDNALNTYAMNSSTHSCGPSVIEGNEDANGLSECFGTIGTKRQKEAHLWSTCREPQRQCGAVPGANGRKS